LVPFNRPGGGDSGNFTPDDHSRNQKFHLFCRKLHLQDIMTHDEEYYYANDFGARFRNQIMQPRTIATDPEWPRLHPAVEECLKELGQ
jgi:hypothetical protein